jgi:hypothetical protein
MFGVRSDWCVSPGNPVYPTEESPSPSPPEDDNTDEYPDEFVVEGQDEMTVDMTVGSSDGDDLQLKGMPASESGRVEDPMEMAEKQMEKPRTQQRAVFDVNNGKGHLASLGIDFSLFLMFKTIHYCCMTTDSRTCFRGFCVFMEKIVLFSSMIVKVEILWALMFYGRWGTTFSVTIIFSDG